MGKECHLIGQYQSAESPLVGTYFNGKAGLFRTVEGSYVLDFIREWSSRLNILTWKISLSNSYALRPEGAENIPLGSQ